MTREQAIEKVRKLRHMTVARGATDPEESSAKAMADRLIVRFALTEDDVREPRQVRPLAPWLWQQPNPTGMLFFTTTGFQATANGNTTVRIVFT